MIGFLINQVGNRSLDLILKKNICTPFHF